MHEVNTKVVATVEARMTSSRLPGKVLMLASGKPMLEHLVERLRATPSIDEIVIATTVNEADQAIVDFALNIGVSYYRGSEDDVMQRVIEAAKHVKADVIVEITGDCPIIDPDIVEQTIRTYMENNADYVSNVVVRSYPDGMDVQVIKLEALIKSSTMTDEVLDREHVSLHIRNHPEIFSQINLVAPPSLHWPELGLTLDEEDDYQLLNKIIKSLSNDNPIFGCSDVISLLKQNEGLLELNQHVVRKGNS